MQELAAVAHSQSDFPCNVIRDFSFCKCVIVLQALKIDDLGKAETTICSLGSYAQLH